jgi:hypothetical protein
MSNQINFFQDTTVLKNGVSFKVRNFPDWQLRFTLINPLNRIKYPDVIDKLDVFLKSFLNKAPKSDTSDFHITNILDTLADEKSKTTLHWKVRKRCTFRIKY